MLEGRRFGELHGCFFSVKEITGVRFCSQRFVVDSVDGLSYFLLSTGVFYDEYGYDVMLTHDTTNRTG